MSLQDLTLAILLGDVTALSRAPGIGKKTAQRIALELKDRITQAELSPPPARPPAAAPMPPAASVSEALEALIALGYSSQEARRLGQVKGSRTSPDELISPGAARHGRQMETSKDRLTHFEWKDNALITGTFRAGGQRLDNSLRPHTLREYVGQEPVKESLNIYIQAALNRHEPLDHMLLYGPPGLGKTTLATIVAAEMGQNIHITSGPAIERPGDLASILANLSQGDVLFIDEIHRLSRSVEEVLYPAMEDFSIDIMIGKGPTARSLRVPVPRFTLVGATTRAGLLSAPLRDRFGIIYRLELYTPEELARIVSRSASILKVTDAEESGMLEIARRSRGTPRIANRMLKRVRDYAQCAISGTISAEVANEALRMEGIDELGLDKTDRTMLATMMDKFGGGPVGLDTLAATTGEDATTIEDVYEPYLMQLGFIMRTPRGRVCTPAAWAHMKRTMPQTAQTADGADDQMRMDCKLSP